MVWFTLTNLHPGYLPFSIEHGDYFPFEDSLLVQGDTSFYVSMSNRLASVFFEIDDGTLPLVNALVKFNKQSYLFKSGRHCPFPKSAG